MREEHVERAWEGKEFHSRNTEHQSFRSQLGRGRCGQAELKAAWCGLLSVLSTAYPSSSCCVLWQCIEGVQVEIPSEWKSIYYVLGSVPGFSISCPTLILIKSTHLTDRDLINPELWKWCIPRVRPQSSMLQEVSRFVQWSKKSPGELLN